MRPLYYSRERRKCQGIFLIFLKKCVTVPRGGKAHRLQRNKNECRFPKRCQTPPFARDEAARHLLSYSTPSSKIIGNVTKLTAAKALAVPVNDTASRKADILLPHRQNEVLGAPSFGHAFKIFGIFVEGVVLLPPFGRAEDPSARKVKLDVARKSDRARNENTRRDSDRTVAAFVTCVDRRRDLSGVAIHTVALCTVVFNINVYILSLRKRKIRSYHGRTEAPRSFELMIAYGKGKVNPGARFHKKIQKLAKSPYFVLTNAPLSHII